MIVREPPNVTAPMTPNCTTASARLGTAPGAGVMNRGVHATTRAATSASATASTATTPTERRENRNRPRLPAESMIHTVATGANSAAEHREHDRAEAVQRAAQPRADTERGVRDRECQHDRERRSAEAEPREETARPAGALMPEEDAELRRRRARQHVDEREPFDELRLADPLPALLELGLHHADDRGAAVGRQTDLEKAGQDLMNRASPPRLHVMSCLPHAGLVEGRNWRVPFAM